MRNAAIKQAEAMFTVEQPVVPTPTVTEMPTATIFSTPETDDDLPF